MYNLKFTSRWNWEREREEKEKVRFAFGKRIELNLLRKRGRASLSSFSNKAKSRGKNFFGENGWIRTKFAFSIVRETSCEFFSLVESCRTESKWRFISGATTSTDASRAFDTILRYADPIFLLHLSDCNRNGLIRLRRAWSSFQRNRTQLFASPPCVICCLLLPRQP